MTYLLARILYIAPQIDVHCARNQWIYSKYRKLKNSTQIYGVPTKVVGTVDAGLLTNSGIEWPNYSDNGKDCAYKIMMFKNFLKTMKRIIYVLVTLSLLTNTKSFAQVAKGKFLVGGLINPAFSRKTSSNNFSLDTWVINSQIRFGYFPTNRFSFGLDLEHYFSIDKSSVGSAQVSSLTGGPFTRFYFSNYKFSAFAEVAGGVGTSSSRYKYIYSNGGFTDNNFTSKEVYLKLGPGINYFLTDNVALEALLTYQRYLSKYNRVNSNNANNTVDLLNLKVGLIVLL